MSEHIIKVRDQASKVVLRLGPEDIWTATGYYMGERIQVSGPTQSSALAAWHEAARSSGA